MKMIKTAFIGVLLIGLVNCSIPPDSVTQVVFELRQSDIVDFERNWYEGQPVIPSIDPAVSQVKMTHPCTVDLSVTLARVHGGIGVFNDGFGDVSYVAHDHRTDTWTKQTIGKREVHIWNTVNPCSIHFSVY